MPELRAVDRAEAAGLLVVVPEAQAAGGEDLAEVDPEDSAMSARGKDSA
jgi:hypothetical protein